MSYSCFSPYICSELSIVVKETDNFYLLVAQCNMNSRVHQPRSYSTLSWMEILLAELLGCGLESMLIDVSASPSEGIVSLGNGVRKFAVGDCYPSVAHLSLIHI